MKYAALDLDRTLFNTDAFSGDLRRVCATIVGVNYDDFCKDTTGYKYVSREGLSHYDLFAQLHMYGAVYSPKLVAAIKNGILALQKSYIYKDVSAFITKLQQNDYEIFILSYGETRYQTLKVQISPELQNLQVVVVQEPKSKYLSAYKGRQGILFDDVEQESLPGGWHSELIDRQVHPNDALIRLVL